MKFDFNKLVNGLESLEDSSDVAIRMYSETIAKDFEAHAKACRPWKDRTGDARKRLVGYTLKKSNGYRIILAHGVEYGVWLELANNKNYAIIQPTINLKSNDAINSFNKLLEKL